MKVVAEEETSRLTEILQPLPIPPILIAGFAVEVAIDTPVVAEGMTIPVAAEPTDAAVDITMSMAELPWFISMMCQIRSQI